MHANYQASGSIGVQGGGGDIQKDGRHAILPRAIMNYLHPPELAREE